MDPKETGSMSWAVFLVYLVTEIQTNLMSSIRKRYVFQERRILRYKSAIEISVERKLCGPQATMPKINAAEQARWTSAVLVRLFLPESDWTGLELSPKCLSLQKINLVGRVSEVIEIYCYPCSKSLVCAIYCEAAAESNWTLFLVFSVYWCGENCDEVEKLSPLWRDPRASLTREHSFFTKNFSIFWEQGISWAMNSKVEFWQQLAPAITPRRIACTLLT